MDSQGRPNVVVTGTDINSDERITLRLMEKSIKSERISIDKLAASIRTYTVYIIGPPVYISPEKHMHIVLSAVVAMINDPDHTYIVIDPSFGESTVEQGSLHELCADLIDLPEHLRKNLFPSLELALWSLEEAILAKPT